MHFLDLGGLHEFSQIRRLEMQITFLYKVEVHDDGSQLFDIIFGALLYIFPEHLEELRVLKVHNRLGRLLWQHELLHMHF